MLEIDDRIPAGNIVVDRVAGDDVYLRPDQRDSAEWWFYWSFRVAGAAGRTLHFHFDGRDPITSMGPAVSRDGGRTWSWLGRESEQARFSYRFADHEHEVRFAVGIPYLQSHLEAFLHTRSAIGRLTLCRTPGGRDVEWLRLGRRDGATTRLLVTVRHHCCESSASYVMEGLVDELLDGPVGRRVEAHVIPFMDKDGVENGDRGKHRRGRDHNRDYGDPSHYAEVAALKQLVRSWPPTDRLVTFDLHSPSVRGQYHESIYIVGSSNTGIWATQQQLSDLVSKRCVDGLPHAPADNLPFGIDWNTPANRGSFTPCSRWMVANGATLACAWEIPYALVHDVVVTPANLRQFGRRLGAALDEWLER